MLSDFNKPSDALTAVLKNVVGSDGWTSGSEASRHYEDPRGRFVGKGNVVLMPNSTLQVAEIVKLCNEAAIGIVPFSGGTGVVAGQLSTDNENAIILSLERMNKIRNVDVDDGVIVAEAGCILESIHNTALDHNMTFPLSMASKGSCCIGGNLATNAGGIQVVRHGNARDLCLGIEAVLASGAIYNGLSPLRKDNTGYDLRHLLIGSEGTLGIITAATLITKPVDPETVTTFCAVNSPIQALKLFKRVRGRLGESISALELMSGFGVRLVRSHFPAVNAPFPEDHAWYLLLEASGQVGIRDHVEEELSDCLGDDLLLDAVIAQSQTQRSSLWDLRENTPEANRLSGAFCSSDTSVPISKVNAFIDQVTCLVTRINPNLRINTYGHIGDGNIHHNVLPPKSVQKTDFIAANPEIVEAVRMAINDATQEFGGSISAEHGIGRLKAKDLQDYADVAKLDAIKAIKAALDPQNILNPGAIL